MSRRILFFGITGTEKREVLKRLANWAHKNRSRTCKIFDFEETFLKNAIPRSMNYFRYLDQDLDEQCHWWREAWRRFVSSLSEYEKLHPDHDLFIGLHGCFTRPYYGARSVIRPEQVAELGADRIVTLIDNVYDIWWRTQQRAGKEPYKGTPTLQHLLLARQVETLVADQVAYSNDTARVSHLVIAINHPLVTLGNWLYSEAPKVVYLCFPISDPRKLLKRADATGQSEVNSFLKHAYAFQQTSPDCVLVCPLAIDELPLKVAYEEFVGSKTDAGDEAMPFDREGRIWSLGSVFPNGTELLSPGPLPKGARPAIPVHDIETALGTIRTDVAWRDYRLVDQSQCVAAYSPCLRQEFGITAGCEREINYAAHTRGIPVYLLQEPKNDPNSLVKKHWHPDAGSMLMGHGEDRIIWIKELDQMFSSIQFGAGNAQSVE